MNKKECPVVVFALRHDSVSDRNEGEYYVADEKGLTNVEMWSSPKLTDHQVYICVGRKAVREGFKRYEDYLAENSLKTPLFK